MEPSGAAFNAASATRTLEPKSNWPWELLLDPVVQWMGRWLGVFAEPSKGGKVIQEFQGRWSFLPFVLRRRGERLCVLPTAASAGAGV